MLPGDHKQEPKFNLWPNPNCTSHLLRGGWKLVISDTRSHNLCYVNDVIIRAAIVAHSKRRTQFTLRRPHLFGTKLTQRILLGEL